MTFPRYAGQNVIVTTTNGEVVTERFGIVTRNNVSARGKRLIRVLFSDHQNPLVRWCDPAEVEEDEWEPESDNEEERADGCL